MKNFIAKNKHYVFSSESRTMYFVEKKSKKTLNQKS